MKQSLRAKRKARHHKRLGAGGKLNLVSLMDIFTILVFFLMVNQSEVRVLQNTKELKLPVSIAEQLPHENIVISVLKDSILVQERLIWQQVEQPSGAQLTASAIKQLVAALKVELTYQTNKRPELTEQEKINGRAVTIIGDASIEYDILKQIMAICAEADYRNMSLAVEQIAVKDVNNGGV
ncbi:MAG: ExbD/TolR family protein [Thalassotalea sp.]